MNEYEEEYSEFYGWLYIIIDRTKLMLLKNIMSVMDE